MRRARFEQAIQEYYDDLARYVFRLRAEPDLLHDTIGHILGNKTYRSVRVRYVKRWLYYKISRESVRSRRAAYIRSQAVRLATPEIIADLQEREYQERPDTAIILRELIDFRPRTPRPLAKVQVRRSRKPRD
jgi:hypothetical protein